ncbi:MAG TPA: hypothetical protein VIE43_13965 [Thermoanaerobaculia bacterium]|jgi:hypothetical protein|nr:hypothetical protein [Thermoanaerobaculia bacterium]
MKKQASLRLKLHRETLRTLASPELEAAQGGAATTGKLTVATCQVNLCAPPHVTVTCPTICGTACSATTQTC